MKPRIVVSVFFLKIFKEFSTLLCKPTPLQLWLHSNLGDHGLNKLESAQPENALTRILRRTF